LSYPAVPEDGFYFAIPIYDVHSINYINYDDCLRALQTLQYST
jgi:hypothetical protein